MTWENELATGLGIAGNVVATLMFLSNITHFIRIVRKKSTDSYSIWPYLATLCNCVLWVIYGIPYNKDVTLVVTINGIGIVLNVIYLGIFLGYASKPRREWLATIASLVSLAAVCLGTVLGVHSKSTRISVFGILSCVFNVFMYWSPFSNITGVWAAKSLEYLPIYFCITVFVNSCLWLGYAGLKHDWYIGVPNFLGVVAGVFQIFCIYKFYKPGDLLKWQVPEPKKADTETNKGETNKGDIEKGIEMTTDDKNLEDVSLEDTPKN